MAEIDSTRWQAFFDRVAPSYMQEVFTHDTAREVEFLAQQFPSAPARVLDLGCGTGRHSVGLAKLGYQVTGVDLSQGMLEQARLAAVKAKVDVEWIQADATEFRPEEPFDAAYCVCEGSFGLFSQGDGMSHDRKVLATLATVIKPGGLLLLTALNGWRLIRETTPQKIQEGQVDLFRMTELDPYEIEGEPIKLPQHYWTPRELAREIKEAGFRITHHGGGTAGNWGIRPIELDE
ncbi:MAG: class I SAM-dependent methyltransferase, partial [Fimbriimonadaceae bacterium]